MINSRRDVIKRVLEQGHEDPSSALSWESPLPPTVLSQMGVASDDKRMATLLSLVVNTFAVELLLKAVEVQRSIHGAKEEEGEPSRKKIKDGKKALAPWAVSTAYCHIRKR